jgi:hypothetical protein
MAQGAEQAEPVRRAEPVGRSGREQAAPGGATTGVGAGAGDRAGVGVGVEMTLGLAALARHVVGAVAPEQVELVERIPARWTADEAPGRERWGWAGGTVASGMAPTVLSEIVFPLLTGVFTQVLGTSALHGWQQRRRLRRRPAEPPVAQVRLRLDADQITRLRSTCAAYARTLGLAQPEADLLAAALAGALQQALDEGPSDRTTAAGRSPAGRTSAPEPPDAGSAAGPPSPPERPAAGSAAGRPDTAPTEPPLPLPSPGPTPAPAPPAPAPPASRPPAAEPLGSADPADRDSPPAS